MAQIHYLKNIQKIPAGIEEVWKFFSSPGNLLAITLPSLNLKMTNESSGNEVYTGQTMMYKVKPLLGIPLHWTTEITTVERFRLFVDEQRKGPFRLWRHEHHFKPIESGVEMIDIVRYQLPLGILGNVMHPLIVKNKLLEIFTHRYFKINEIFGDWTDSEMNLTIN